MPPDRSRLWPSFLPRSTAPLVGDPALPAGLVEEDGGGGGDIQAVSLAQHRQPDRRDVRIRPRAREAAGLVADDDRNGASQIDVAVERLSVDPSRDDPDRRAS